MLDAVAAETAEMPEPIWYLASLEQAQAVLSLGDLSLAVVTGAHHPWPTGTSTDVELRLEHEWQRINDELLQLSTRSKRWVATHSGHFSQIDDPTVVIDAIHWVAAAHGW